MSPKDEINVMSKMIDESKARVDKYYAELEEEALSKVDTASKEEIKQTMCLLFKELKYYLDEAWPKVGK